MFGSDGLSMTIDRLKCIAKMKYLGFKLIPWNIEDFKESVNDACDDRIEQAVSYRRTYKCREIDSICYRNEPKPKHSELVSHYPNHARQYSDEPRSS